MTFRQSASFLLSDRRRNEYRARMMKWKKREEDDEL